VRHRRDCSGLNVIAGRAGGGTRTALATLRLGSAFAVSATPILKVLLPGIFLNSCAHVSYAYLQSHGHSDLTAQLHLAELPVFAVLLVWAVHAYGVPGAAPVWTLRVALDTGMPYLSVIIVLLVLAVCGLIAWKLWQQWRDPLLTTGNGP